MKTIQSTITLFVLSIALAASTLFIDGVTSPLMAAPAAKGILLTDSVRIQFEPGTSSTELTDTVRPGRFKSYVLRAMQGQIMSVGIYQNGILNPNGDVQLQIVGAESGPIFNSGRELPTWTGELPVTQDYYLYAVSVGPNNRYRLNVAIEPLNRQPVTPNPVDVERVNFARGAVSASRAGELFQDVTKQYVLNAQAGQQMDVFVSSFFSPVDFAITAPNGTTWGSERLGSEVWASARTITLPQSGDYTVTMQLPPRTGATEYNIEFTVTSGVIQPPVTPPITVDVERVNFARGATSATRDGELFQDVTKQYLLNAQAGQQMEIYVSSLFAPVSFTVTAPNGATWSSAWLGSEAWVAFRRITLPQNGDYTVEMHLPPRTGVTEYNIQFTITGATVQPPVTNQPERVRFAPGKSSATVETALPANGQKQYVLNAQAGQILDVNINSPIVDTSTSGVAMTIRSPRGTVWQGIEMGLGVYMTNRTLTLPKSGDYTISLNGSAGEPYTANFSVVNAPTLADERIRFARGASSAQLNGYMAHGGTKRYVLGASAGQEMSVTVSSLMAQVGFSISAPSGTMWLSEPLGADVWLSALTITLPESGDYTVILNTPWANGSTQYNISFTIE